MTAFMVTDKLNHNTMISPLRKPSQSCILKDTTMNVAKNDKCIFHYSLYLGHVFKNIIKIDFQITFNLKIHQFCFFFNKKHLKKLKL